MKKMGILNSHITKVLCDLGHTDQIVIADAGLPIPEDVLKIDISLVKGVPTFLDTLDAVLDDMVVEKVVISIEIELNNDFIFQEICKRFPCEGIEKVTHEQFKKLTKHAKAVIRTGEVTPYANCILQAGVIF